MLRRMKDQKGFSLIGVAIVVLLAGLFMGGVFSLLRPLDREKQEAITRVKMQKIIYALSVYSQRHLRLPCPAEPNRAVALQPFGAERGSGVDGDDYGDCGPPPAGAVVELEGIVPFKTLGLPERDVRDGWRNYITYRVSENFKGVDLANTGSWPKVHEQCRIKDVWVDTNAGPPLVMNLNPGKAIFCCGAPEDGFDVEDNVGGSLVYDGGGGGGGGGIYQNVWTNKPPPALTTTEVLDTLAVVLVSHGQNAHGAYLDDGSKLNMGNVSVPEAENASNDGLYVLTARTEADNAYFDDLVVWRTQKALNSEVGNYSETTCGAEPLLP